MIVNTLKNIIANFSEDSKIMFTFDGDVFIKAVGYLKSKNN